MMLMERRQCTPETVSKQEMPGTCVYTRVRDPEKAEAKRIHEDELRTKGAGARERSIP